MAFISHLVYRSYKRVVGVLYRVGRLGIERMLSACYALICGVMACAMAVHSVGYAVMAYGLGLRVRPTG